MPKTVKLRPAVIDTLLTNERLASYQSVFRPATDLELMGAYLWNSQVCGVLYPLVSAAEVALRNAIDHGVSGELGRFWWTRSRLRYKSFGQGQPPKPVTVVSSNFAKSYARAIDAARRATGNRNARPTHGAVVAGTDFSTWEYLLDDEFMGRGLIWPKVLGGVLCGPWPGNPTQTLRHARTTAKTVREFRNRLSHHEPAWKRYGVVTEVDAVLHLREKIARIEELLALVHPEKLRLLERNGFLPAARRTCSIDELRRCQLAHRRSKVGTMRKLQGVVDLAYRQDRAIEVSTFGGDHRRFLLVPLGA